MSAKRSREESVEEIGKSSKKRKNNDEETSLRKLFNLLSAESSISAGLVYLFNEIKEHGNTNLRCSYLNTHPDCNHVLSLLEQSTKLHEQDNVLLCFMLLEDILLFTADDEHYVTMGSRLATALLESHMTSINYSLSPNKPAVLVAAALKLLTAIVMQGRNTAIEVLNKFDFGSSYLDPLPRQHKKFKEDEDSVRVCFIKFAMAFLVIGDSFVISQLLLMKIALSTQIEFISTLFRGLKKDPDDIRQVFLLTIHNKIVKKRNIAKKNKICIFNGFNLKFLVEFLSDSNCQDEVSKNVAYNILQCLCSDLKYGICFKPVRICLNNNKTNNPLLLHMAFNCLPYIGHFYTRDIIVSTISSCPDVLVPFLNGASLDVDPKPTQKWVWHMELLLSLLSDCSQLKHFIFEGDNINLAAAAQRGNEPSKYIKSYIECCCPSLLSRTVLSNGIQSNCLIIKDICLKGMLLILNRTHEFQTYLYGETRQVLCNSVLCRLPDIKTVMTLRHVIVQLLTGCGLPSNGNTMIPSDEFNVLARNEEISHSGSELFSNVSTALYLYQKLVPTLLAQANINIAKLLIENVAICNGFSQPPAALLSVIQTTLDILLETPVDSLQSILKNEFISCLLKLIVTEEYQESVIQIFMKCLQVYPCLLDYDYQLFVIFNVIISHLTSPLYTEEDIDSLKSIVVQVMTQLTKKSFKWFDIFVKVPQGAFKEDEIGNYHKSELLCPLLVLFLEQCNKSPSIPCVLLVSELILKLVHTSVDPVTAASDILKKLDQDDQSFLNLDTTGSINECIHLIKNHLKVWSNSPSEQRVNKTNDGEICDIETDECITNDVKGIKEYLLNCIVCQPLTSTVLVKLLSSTIYYQPTLFLLDALPIPLIDSSLKKLKKHLPCFQYLQQCINFQCHTDLWTAIKCNFSEARTLIVLKWFAKTSETLSLYRSRVACGYIVSLFSCLLIHFKHESAKEISYFLELLAVLLDNCTLEQINLCLSLIYDQVVSKVDISSQNSTNSGNNLFVFQFVSFCISLGHPSLDRLLYSILSAPTATVGEHTVSLSSCLQLSSHLLEQSNTDPHLKHSKTLFQYLHDLTEDKAFQNQAHDFDISLAKRLLEYSSRQVSSDKSDLLMLVMRQYPLELCLSYVVRHLCSPAITGSSKFSTKVLEVIRLVLQKWKEEKHTQINQEELRKFINNASYIFKEVLLNKSIQKSSAVCKDIIEDIIILYPSIKRSLKRLFYKIFSKSRANGNLSDFNAEMIGILSFAVVPNDMELWLSSIEYLLYKLRKKIKKQSSDKHQNEGAASELILIEAISKSLKCVSIDEIDIELSSEFVEVWNKFVLKAISKRIECSSMMRLLTELITFIYYNKASQMTTVSPESIYNKIWSKTNHEEITAAHIQLLFTVTQWITDTSVYKTDHIISLLGSYTATLSQKDTCILSLLSLYERSGISLVEFSPLVWGTKAFETYRPYQESTIDKDWLLWKQPTLQEILSLVDIKMLESSTEQFPYTRTLEPTVTVAVDSTVYDPCFIIPLMATVLNSASGFDCRSFVASGYLSYIITATSSLCKSMREAAFYCLSSFNDNLMAADKFSEKHQLSVLMDLLHNSVVEKGVRLPIITSLLFSKAAVLFTHTEQDMFPIIADNMISKPFIDTRDIPLYEVLLQSPRPEECLWELQLLCDGLKSDSVDYHIYSKHNVIPHLMCLYMSPLLNDKSKSLIIEFLIKASTNKKASHDLTWNFNFLSWIHNLNQSDPTLLEMICNTYQTVTTNGLRSALYLEEDVAITMTHLHQSL